MNMKVGLCTTLGLAKRMRLRGAGFKLKNVLCRQICPKSALRSQILFASPELVSKHRLDSLLYFDTHDLYRNRMEKQNASARRLLASPARALAADLLRQDHVLSTIEQIFRFHKNKIEKMLCRLDCIENPRLFDKYPTHLEKWLENLPLSRMCFQAEMKRPGRGGVMFRKGFEGHHANITLDQSCLIQQIALCFIWAHEGSNTPLLLK